MEKYISKLIKTTLSEDLNNKEDITGSAIFQNEKDHFYLLAKDEGILCGIFSPFFVLPLRVGFPFSFCISDGKRSLIFHLF